MSDHSSRPDRHKKKRSKKKSKSKTVEDAIEKKLREKKKKEQAAEDALEAKIRAKQTAADGDEEAPLEEAPLEEAPLEDHHRRLETSSRSSKSHRSSAPQPMPSAGGGGDVRNRPPPSLQPPQVDPLRAAEEETKKHTKQVNQRYADLYETGQWGGLSKWEKYGLCLLAIVAIGVAAGLGVKFTNEARTDAPTSAPSISPTASPSTSPTPLPTDGSYRAIQGLEAMKASSPNLAFRVDAPEELIGSSDDPTATPQEMAGEFVLYDDNLQIPVRDARFLERYALAVFYYSNGGCAGDWFKTTNWLKVNQDHCKWYGVVCDLQGRVTELAMEGNYVTGQLIQELSQVKELSTLDLSNNRMGGQVSANALNITSLFTLRLNNNQFTGDMPLDTLLKGSPQLSKCLSRLMVHVGSFFISHDALQKILYGFKRIVD